MQGRSTIDLSLSVKEPGLFLGAQIQKFCRHGSDEPEKPFQSMSSDTYIKYSSVSIETDLSKINFFLRKHVATPIAVGYRPELDSSKELNHRQISLYQGFRYTTLDL